MSVVIAQIDIAAPPEKVWEIVMDADRALEWVTIAREMGETSDGPLRQGYRMDQKLCLRGVNFWVHWELKEVDAPNFARWEGKGPARSKAIIEERFTARNGGTHLDYRNEFKAPLGPLGAAASRVVTGGIPEREANATLQQLKKLVESETG